MEHEYRIRTPDDGVDPFQELGTRETPDPDPEIEIVRDLNLGLVEFTFPACRVLFLTSLLTVLRLLVTVSMMTRASLLLGGSSTTGLEGGRRMAPRDFRWKGIRRTIPESISDPLTPDDSLEKISEQSCTLHLDWATEVRGRELRQSTHETLSSST